MKLLENGYNAGTGEMKDLLGQAAHALSITLACRARELSEEDVYLQAANVHGEDQPLLNATTTLLFSLVARYADDHLDDYGREALLERLEAALF